MKTEMARIASVVRQAEQHGVMVGDETVAHWLDDWAGCWVEYRADGSGLYVYWLGDGCGKAQEGWDSERRVAWAEVPGIRPLDLLDGMRLFDWARALAWAEACADELYGTREVLSVGRFTLWAEAMAHLGRALRGWGCDDMQSEDDNA